MKSGPSSQPSARVRTAAEVVELHNRHWAAGEVDALFGLYGEDMVFRDQYSGRTYGGADLRRHVADVIARSALDSLRYTDRPRVDGDTVTLQYVEVIRSGKGDALLTVRACDIVRVRDGKIVEINEYAIPVAEEGGAVTRTQAPNTRPSAEKIGLSPRALGFLLRDLAAYIERDKPYQDVSLSLSDVAQATGYSRNQISFALNQGLGTTFFAYINRARIEDLLRRVPVEQCSMESMAKAAGFRSLSTFYSAFRAVTGVSPARYFAGKG